MPFFQQVAFHSNESIFTGLLPQDHTRECLQCCTEHGIHLPGVEPAAIEEACAFNMQQWLIRYGYPGLGRYAIGGLVERLLAHSQDPSPPLRIYSAHDSTLVALLANLAITTGDSWPPWALEWPPYASILEVETWRNMRDGAKAVRFVFNGTILHHESGGVDGLVSLRDTGSRKE